MSELSPAIDNDNIETDNTADEIIDLEQELRKDTQSINNNSSTKPLGFDSKSNAIHYYDYEKKSR